MSSSKSVLYVVATPIGNLSDMTPRAIEVLSKVDWIAAEDTRHSSRLLDHFQVSTKMVSLHAHNEADKSASLVERLSQGESGALISDAGTPLIQDPGFILVKQAQEANIEVIPIPGACAFVCALSVCGLPCDSFTFCGFLSAKSKSRCDQLQALSHKPETLIFYESPHRFEDSLSDMKKVLGADRPCFIGREMTKKFESYYRGSLGELIDLVLSKELVVMGEFVVIVGGNPEQMNESNIEADKILRVLLSELPINQASKLVSLITGEHKREIYQRALKIKG